MGYALISTHPADEKKSVKQYALFYFNPRVDSNSLMVKLSLGIY